MAILDTVLVTTNSNQVVGTIVKQYDSTNVAGASDANIYTANIKLEGTDATINCVLDIHANDVGVGPDNVAYSKKLVFTFAGANKVTPSGGGGSAIPGQAAHYIGTWSNAITYNAGDCIRAWDGIAFNIYQASQVTINDDPTATAAWSFIGTPIVMWGTENPLTSDPDNINGMGIPGIDGMVYLWSGSGLNGQGGVVMVYDDGNFWTAGGEHVYDSPVDQNIYASSYSYVRVTGGGSGTADVGITAQTNCDGTGNASANSHADRGGIGTGNADVTSRATINDTANGTAYSGDIALHHTGGEAHVLPTANADRAWNDVKGPIEFTENGVVSAISTTDIEMDLQSVVIGTGNASLETLALQSSGNGDAVNTTQASCQGNGSGSAIVINTATSTGELSGLNASSTLTVGPQADGGAKKIDQVIVSSDNSNLSSEIDISVIRDGAGTDNAIVNMNSIRMGSGIGNAVSEVVSNISDSAQGLAISSLSSSHFSGNQAHVNVIASDTRGWIDGYGDYQFSNNTMGPVIHDQSDGHTYRIICTNGVLSTALVT